MSAVAGLGCISHSVIHAGVCGQLLTLAVHVLTSALWMLHARVKQPLLAMPLSITCSSDICDAAATWLSTLYL